MSEYPGLKPIYASSTLHVTAAGHFTQVITYDYKDLGRLPPGTTSSGKFIRTPLPASTAKDRRRNPKDTYAQFLEVGNNYEKEIDLYWDNLQAFLNEEKNLVNGVEVHLQVVDCAIRFREKLRPYLQWIVEFTGKLHPGDNIYEFHVASEILEYDIYSLYIFEPPLRVTRVDSTLTHEILLDGQAVEFDGETGELLSPYERIIFTL